MAATIGPFSATFKGDVVQSNISAPTGYTLTARAHGGAVGFGKIEAQVALAEDQDGTVLKYIATAEIGGKLASLGNWLVQIAAQKTADDFFAAFNRRLSAARVKASVPSLPHANQYRG